MFGQSGQWCCGQCPNKKAAGGKSGGFPSSERPQEVEQVLLLPLAQQQVVRHHAVRLRAVARVRADRDDQVRSAAIVQEEQALTEAPERRATELARAGLTLRDSVGE